MAIVSLFAKCQCGHTKMGHPRGGPCHGWSEPGPNPCPCRAFALPKIPAQEPDAQKIRNPDTLIQAWYCYHRGVLAIGEGRQEWEEYCQANRRCEVGAEGCHSVLLTQEFIDTYKGEIAR